MMNRMTVFAVNGTKYSAPEMWLMGRMRTYGTGKKAMLAAMRDWAEQCQLEARFKAQTAQERGEGVWKNTPEFRGHMTTLMARKEHQLMTGTL